MTVAGVWWVLVDIGMLLGWLYHRKGDVPRSASTAIPYIID